MKIKVLFLLAMTAASASAFADRVELANGDSLSGTILKIADDKLTIETAHAGEVQVDWGQIQRIDVDKPLEFTLSDGNAIQGTLELSGDSASVTGADGERVVVSKNDIQGAGPIPPPGPPPLVWHGEALAGATVVRGNTDTDAVHVGGRMVGEQKALRRYTVNAAFNRESNEGETTKDQYLLGAKYDHFFSDVWYGYLGADFEKDKFKDLDLRSVFGAGAGYQFYNEEDLKLSLEGGLTYTDDNYRKGEDDRYAGVGWGLNWEQKFLGSALTFFHRHRGIKGLDSADNFVINAETGARFPLLAGFNATLEYDVDYDNDPPAGVEKTDSTYILGIGYTW